MPSIKPLILGAIKLAFALALPGSMTSAAWAQSTPSPPNYPPCGGLTAGSASRDCPKGYICVDDPRRTGCGMACDMPGICVEPIPCWGFAGRPCQDKNKICIDDPTDGCDPKNGGRDCLGLCV